MTVAEDERPWQAHAELLSQSESCIAYTAWTKLLLLLFLVIICEDQKQIVEFHIKIVYGEDSVARWS